MRMFEFVFGMVVGAFLAKYWKELVPAVKAVRQDTDEIIKKKLEELAKKEKKDG